MCATTFNLNVFYVLLFADVRYWGRCVAVLYIWIKYKSFNPDGLNMVMWCKMVFYIFHLMYKIFALPGYTYFDGGRAEQALRYTIKSGREICISIICKLYFMFIIYHHAKIYKYAICIIWFVGRIATTN